MFLIIILSRFLVLSLTLWLMEQDVTSPSFLFVTLMWPKGLWWLIVYVNLIKHYLWICLWRCFPVRLAFELMDSGWYHSILWVPEQRAEKWNMFSFLLACLSDTLISCPGISVYTISSPDSHIFTLKLNYNKNLLRFPACKGMIVRFLGIITWTKYS